MKIDNKNFNCINYKRKAQSEIYKEIKDLSSQDEISYFHKKVLSGPFTDWLRNIKMDN